MKMARMTFEELNINLDQCITAGVIYNVDFNEWKTYRASCMLENDIEAIRDNFTYAGKWEDRSCKEIDLIEAISYSITTFPSKKFLKIFNVMKVSDTPLIHAVTDIVNKWTPVGDKFRTLKSMIVKGRKPSTTPRTSNERTTDNTGTCSVCGKNVKLSNGKIVSHGFTIRHGWQEGLCLGVDHAPWEVSPDGLKAYIGVIENTMKFKSDSIAKISNKKFKTKMTDDERKNQLYSLERDIRFLGKDLEDCVDRVDNWKSSPLP
jgi:hypothetical protein